MILGLSIPAFTQLHVVISLIGIASGAVFLAGLIGRRWLGGWNAVFLISTIATSVTGFFFPITAFGPPHIVGAISLAILALALVALYRHGRAGRWNAVYAGAAAAALYFNCFVGVVQAFQKCPALNALAPTQSEPPFAIAQGLVLIAFVALGVLAIRRSPPGLR